MKEFQKIIDVLNKFNSQSYGLSIKSISISSQTYDEFKKMPLLTTDKDIRSVDALMGVSVHLNNFIPEGVIAICQLDTPDPFNPQFFMIVTEEWKQKNDQKKEVQR